MKSTYTQHFKVDSALFKDCAATSHGCFGAFTGGLDTELVFLRGLESLELYRANPALSLVSTYRMENQKVLDLVKVRLPWYSAQDLVCI